MTTNPEAMERGPGGEERTRMQRYILRRLLTAIPTVFGITVLIFVAMRILPGDPLAQIASESQGGS